MIEEINKLRKPITTYELKDVKIEVEKRKSIRRINNEHITNNIQILETWSGHQVNNVLYDSDIDGKDSQIFRNKILNHQHLYFIVIDNQNNVFGHYTNSNMNQTDKWITDNESFLFTLNNNGRCGIKKYNINPYHSQHATYIWSDSYFYSCGGGYIVT